MQPSPSNRRHIAALAGLAVPALTGALGSAVLHAQTETPPLPQPSVDHGVVAVECAGAAAARHDRAHGAVLDLGVARAGRDAVLTVAHALPATPETVQRDCVVLGERGRQHAITDAWLGDGSSQTHDWAVLLIDERIGGRDVVRLQPRGMGPEDVGSLVRARAPVRVQHGAGSETCEMRDTKWLTRADLNAGVFAHSCATWPGLSGSPLVLPSAAGDTLVGIHLGNMTLDHAEGDPDGGPVTLLSLGRSIDAAVAAALAEAAALAAAR